ncbi:MAG TPA: HAMP domain-containing sensor histidine kinase [Coleofasciculaceae cyanobacterium]|jgi:signal transduction histidine kinase
MLNHFAPLTSYLSWLMTGENLLIAGCYMAIGMTIAKGIWRNRAAGISPVIVSVSAIFFSCALGHGLHVLEMLQWSDLLFWQTAADLITVLVALRFLSFYESFDVLAQISQIVASKVQLESQNKELQQVITQLKDTQIQLVQAEKMSSLGQLVAGIAHEVNNPVNFIYGNLSHVKDHVSDLLSVVALYQKHYPTPADEIQIKIADTDLEFVQTDLHKVLDSMQTGTQRIRQVVLSLRNFSRIDESAFKAVDIHEGIESALLILHHRLKEKPKLPAIQVIRDYGDLPLIECYPSQLNQVLMNILTNAVDALEEFNADRTYEAITEQPSWIKIQTTLIDRYSIQISIADNGLGIPEPIKQQIFNPFFTTKPIGMGTGMGMSISYQIITEKHQGKLECFSTPGKGTEFIMQIPIRQLTPKVKQ